MRNQAGSGYNVLRPMSAGEIIGAALRLFRDHLAVMVSIALLPQVTLLLITLLLSVSGLAAELGMVALALAVLILNAIALSAITFAVAEAVLGRQPTVVGCYRLAFREGLFAVVAGYTIRAVLIFVGVMLLIVPGIILGGFLAPMLPLIVVERARPLDAMVRSFSRMRLHLSAGIAIFVFELAISGMLPLLIHRLVGLGPLTPLLNTVVGAVVLPPAYAANVLLYFAIRAGEGYDPPQLEADLQR